MVNSIDGKSLCNYYSLLVVVGKRESLFHKATELASNMHHLNNKK